MKKLLLLLLIAPVLGYGQGEQRYADGTATDQDGNTFEWINYGAQDWAIENAEVVTYRDGTPIPQVTDATEWGNLTTGAWCYHNNDSTRDKLYNWFAVAGIHDNDPNTPNKEFAPDGWHVPSDTEWTTLVNYLIANGYNYDDTTTQNQIAKSVASTSGWDSSPVVSAVGNNQSLNNTSGFNVTPSGNRYIYGNFQNYGQEAFFHSSSEGDNSSISRIHHMTNESSSFESGNSYKKNGFSVRFVRDASTASSKDYSNSLTIYPNPTSSIINIEQDFTSAKVYDISGKEILKSTSKTIDLSELPSSIYLVRLYDKSNKVLGTSKVVKQ